MQNVVAGRSVGLKEGVQVGGSSFGCCIVGKCQGLEFDTSSNWRPRERFEQWVDMCCFGLVENQMCHCILYHLQRFECICT